jgi:hypothetical protein
MMNPNNCKQQKAQSTLPSLLDQEAAKSSVQPLDGQMRSEENTTTNGLRLCKINLLIENEKWRELDSFLRSCEEEKASCGFSSELLSEEEDKDVVSPLHIGKIVI